MEDKINLSLQALLEFLVADLNSLATSGLNDEKGAAGLDLATLS